MNTEIVNDMYDCLCKFDNAFLESRVEFCNDHRFYLSYIGKKLECYSESLQGNGWYIGNYDSSIYTSSYFDKPDRMIKKYISCAGKVLKYNNVYNDYINKCVKIKEKIDVINIDIILLIEKYKILIQEFVNDNKDISLQTNISVKITKKYYFNNRGQFIFQFPSKHLYFEIAVKGKRGINETLILENKSDEEIEKALYDKFCLMHKLYYIEENSNELNVLPILLKGEAVGMLVHEVFGHSSEIDWGGNEGNNSTQTLTWLNIFDEANLNSNEKYKYDDYGNRCQKNIIIEGGKRIKYLDGNRNSSSYTSNARAQNFQHPPITRMSNTYLDRGTLGKKVTDNLEKDCLVIEKAYNSISLHNGELIIPVKIGFINKNTDMQLLIRNIIVKINKECLQKAELSDEIKMNNMWCIKGGQEILVGAGGPNIFFEYGVVVNG